MDKIQSIHSFPERRKNITGSKRAGLNMSVARFRRHLRTHITGKKISAGAAVYSAAALEYLIAEVLELAGNHFINQRKRKTPKRIVPRDIQMGIKLDEELYTLLQHVTIPEGGVIPHVHPELVMKKKGQKRSSSSKNDSEVQNKIRKP